MWGGAARPPITSVSRTASMFMVRQSRGAWLAICFIWVAELINLLALSGASASRANVVPGVPRYPAKKSVNQWFNPAAFAVPTAYNWGNSGRNILRGPDEINLDSSAEKKFPITEGATLLFRVEFFNMFNHPQFQIPAT
ncbi:MAG: hypothetical protein QOJ51_1119, partial [Acidobacteriaceae bacterium]|nr:hypothetical protein [Acidobacteriaceae bacterium]